ncbi:MAG: acyltransferase [Candidatus Levyibacteriota bacterium]
MKQRLFGADVIRILAIYFVIVVHSTILPTQISPSSIINLVFFAVAKTCVPLFFMLSGGLLLTKEEPDSVFFKKRFTRLFFPWLFWTIIFLLLIIDFHSFSSAQFIASFKRSLRVFWFIPIISVLYIATPALRSFLKSTAKTHIFTLLTIWFLLCSFLPYMRNTLAFPLSNNSVLWQTVSFSGFFVLGYLVVSKKIPLTIAHALLLSAIGLLWTIIGTFSNSSTTNLNIFYFDYFSPSLVSLSLGLFSLLWLWIPMIEGGSSEKIKKYAGNFSTATLGVYLLHTLMLQRFDSVNKTLSVFSFYKPVDSYFNGFILFTVCLLIILVLKKIKPLARFVS